MRSFFYVFRRPAISGVELGTFFAIEIFFVREFREEYHGHEIGSGKK